MEDTTTSGLKRQEENLEAERVVWAGPSDKSYDLWFMKAPSIQQMCKKIRNITVFPQNSCLCSPLDSEEPERKGIMKLFPVSLPRHGTRRQSVEPVESGTS
jgi:hypothetical protein